LHNAQCVSSGGCKLLVIGKDLFSHLTDVFETLGEDLYIRANNHLHATLAQWLRNAKTVTSLRAAPGVTIYPVNQADVQNSKSDGFFSWSRIGIARRFSSESQKGIKDEQFVGWGPLVDSAETMGCLVVVEQGECEIMLDESGVSDSWSVSSINRSKSTKHNPNPNNEDREGYVSKQSTRRVGPGFVCFCAPPRHESNEKQIPPSLRSLPRCVSMKALPPQNDKLGYNGSSYVSITAVAGQELHELLKQPGMSVLRGYVKDLAINEAVLTDSCQSVALSKCTHRHTK
jgi:hypothetical protein